MLIMLFHSVITLYIALPSPKTFFQGWLESWTLKNHIVYRYPSIHFTFNERTVLAPVFNTWKKSEEDLCLKKWRKVKITSSISLFCTEPYRGSRHPKHWGWPCPAPSWEQHPASQSHAAIALNWNICALSWFLLWGPWQRCALRYLSVLPLA